MSVLLSIEPAQSTLNHISSLLTTRDSWRVTKGGFAHQLKILFFPSITRNFVWSIREWDVSLYH